MRISRLGCRRSRDRDRGGPVGTGGHLPGQPCAAGPRRKRLWAQRGRQLLWGPGGPHRAGVGTGIWGALAVLSLPVPVLFAVPRLVFTSSNLRAAPRGGDIGARGLLLGSTPRPLPAPRRLSVPTPRRAGGGWGLLWGAQLLREPGASRRARAGPLGRAPPLPDCCCNDPGGSNEAGNPRACPSPSPAPGQLPQRGSCSSSPWSRPLLSASQRTPFPYPWGAVGVSKMLRVRIAKPGAPPAGSKPAGG